MPRECSICKKTGKGVWKRVKLRGRYNPTIKKRKQPNLQWATLLSGKRVKACTRCIKALDKKK